MIGVSVKFSRTAGKQLNDLQKQLRQNIPKLAIAGAKLIRTNIGHEIDDWAENPTGNLKNSFVVVVGPNQQGAVPKLEATIESTTVYAGIHEYGGVIRPKRARALTIPLTALARRMPAKMWPKGKLFRLKGTSVLASKWGRGVRPQFVLKRSVRIRPKRYITKALKRSRPQLMNLMRLGLRSSLRRVDRGVGYPA